MCKEKENCRCILSLCENMVKSDGVMSGRQINFIPEKTLTFPLQKAKEWYRKGGELREASLEVYQEDELKDSEILTWDDLQKKADGNMYSAILTLPSCKKETKSMEAFAKLSHLLSIYNGADWKPEFNGRCDMKETVIVNRYGEVFISASTSFVRFLVFKDHETASKFLKNNLQLINDYFMIDNCGE